MPSEIQPEVVQAHLQRVLASPGFARNERMSRFLKFIVEQQLNGRESELKESIIGIEVFGRRPGFDPQQDSTVRSEAARLRARLAEYYAADGRGDSLVIELPKGGYTPRFRQPEAASQAPNDERTARSRPRLMVVLIGLMVASAAVGWWRFQHESALIPIAVLPFTNLSQDAANDYFVDGITNEIIRNLSIIDGLAVRSQTSSFALKGRPPNVHEAGKQLAADYILEGSVLRAGQQLRINAQLIRVRDDFPLWSGRYDRELTDIFAIQDEVSRGIVNSLRLKLGRGHRRYETSAEAYDLYLRARALQIRGLSGNSQSIGRFEEAIAKDHSFAPAYAGLAAAYAERSGQLHLGDRRRESSMELARDDELSRMRATAEKAIELDPLLAEAHDALGMSYARDGQWEQSEKSFRHAIKLDPSRSTSYGDFTFNLLLPLGRIEEGLHEMRVAEKADPLSSEVQLELAYTLLSAGRYDEAASRCENLPTDSENKSECLGRAWTGQGRISEAIQVLATASNWGYLGYAYARSGRRDQAEKLAATVPPRPFQQALIFAGLGDKERTLEALERMAGVGPVRLGRDLTYPEFALVRGDQRVKALRKKIGLPEVAHLR